MKPFNWICPVCNHKAVIQENDFSDFRHAFEPNKQVGDQIIHGQIIFCPNEECCSYTLAIGLFDAEWDNRNAELKTKELKKQWQLIPESNAKPFPNYISPQILADYKEACLIKNLSPKASATLARRCLQGMIRDFWKIKKSTLKQEIDALENLEKITQESLDAIKAVKDVGNIGAHMERDINLIIEIEPEEADLLIGLIETLFEDWYIARHDRQQRLSKVTALAESKKLLRSEKKKTEQGATESAKT